jgi:cold shock CspA family protein
VVEQKLQIVRYRRSISELRRAEIKETVEAAPAPAPSLDGVARGVVRWFDPQTRRGGLRLQGVGGDVAVEPQLLAQCNITRLFKGQEVEARLSGTPEAPQLQELKLRTAGVDAHVSSGLVRARQQKPVVVELKREALKRHSARDAAEQLLPNRSR